MWLKSDQQLFNFIDEHKLVIEASVKGIKLPLNPSEGDIIAARSKMRVSELQEGLEVAKGNLRLSRECQGSSARESEEDALRRIEKIQKELDNNRRIIDSHAEGLVERARR